MLHEDGSSAVGAGQKRIPAADDAKPEDRRTRRTKAAIREAFLSIAAEQGITNVTVAAIARKADINRKTFYCHYESLDALIEEFVRENAKELTGAVNAVRFASDGSFNVAELYETLCVSLASGLEKGVPLLAHMNISEWMKTLERVYAQEIAEKKLLFSEGFTETQVRYLAIFTLSGLLSVFQAWVNENSELELETLSAMMSAGVVGALEGFEAFARQSIA